jgi:N-methylhydantoinase A/oxoprolinase/acetone carboxylase beta subunit
MLMPVDIDRVRLIAAELHAEVVQDLTSDGIAPGGQSVSFEADMRFKHQIAELSVAMQSGDIDERAMEQLEKDFRAEYAKRYGAGAMMRQAPTELVTLRAVGIGRTTQASLVTTRTRKGERSPLGRTRSVRIARGQRGVRNVQAHMPSRLHAGSRLIGPALVDGYDTTIWIPPGFGARVDDRGTLVMEVHS